MKSLDVIQTICKILKILTMIAFVCSIIGAATSFVGAIILFCIREDSALWQEAIKHFTETPPDLNYMRCNLVGAVVTCSISAIIMGFAKRFYADEIAAGTPFDRTICKKMLKEGVLYLSLSVVSVVVTAIVYACFGVSYEGSNYSGFGTGIMFVLCWIICRYGADVKEIADKNIAESNYANYANCTDCPKATADERDDAAEE